MSSIENKQPHTLCHQMVLMDRLTQRLEHLKVSDPKEKASCHMAPVTREEFISQQQVIVEVVAMLKAIIQHMKSPDSETAAVPTKPSSYQAPEGGEDDWLIL